MNSAATAAPLNPTTTASCWKKNQERCRALQECQAQLRYWKTRYTRLKAEHKRVGRLQAMRTDAAAVWPHLSARERSNKEYVLAALEHSPTLPTVLKSITHWHTHLAAHLQGDADLWKAQLRRRQTHTTRLSSKNTSIVWTTAVERMVLNPENADLFQQLLVLDPTLLYLRETQEYLGQASTDETWVFDTVLCTLIRDTKQVLVAYEAVMALLQAWESNIADEESTTTTASEEQHAKTRRTRRGKHNHSSKNNNKVKPPPSPVQLRAERLRAYKPFMLALWARPVWNKTKRSMMSPALRNDKEFCLQLAQTASSSDVRFPADALNALSPRLRADIQVVTAFCRRHGGNLALASCGLRRHYQVVRTACTSCPRALLWCLSGPLKHRFWRDHQFVRQLFESCRITAGSTTQHCDLSHDCPTDKYAPVSQASALYKACPADVQPHVLVAAARVGAVPLADVYAVAQAKTAKFWTAVWQVDDSDQGQQHSWPAFCRPYWQWLPDEALCKDQTLALQWLYYHGVYVLQDYTQRKTRLTVHDGVEESVDFLQSVKDILSRFPAVVSNERWLRLVLTSRHPLVPTLLQECLYPRGLNLMDHVDLVLEGCRANGYLIADLPLRIAMQEGIATAALQSHPEALSVVPGAVQLAYPHLVVQAMTAVATKIRKHDQKSDGTYNTGRRFGRDVDDDSTSDDIEDILALAEALVNQHRSDDDSDTDLRLRFSPCTDYYDLFDAVHEDLWENQQVALAWIRAGGSFLHDEFPDTFEDDEEFALALAEFSPSDFMFVSDHLLSDPVFMRKAIAINGSLLQDASGDLPFDLTLLAFASKPDMVEHYDWTNINSADFKFLVDLARRVRTRLLEHESFFTFLRGFADTSSTLVGDSSVPNAIKVEKEALRQKHSPRLVWEGSPVALLECGQETSYTFKRSIADFIGVPVGEELRLLRRCSEHLQQWGF